jgi:hypothetical protein
MPNLPYQTHLVEPFYFILFNIYTSYKTNHKWIKYIHKQQNDFTMKLFGTMPIDIIKRLRWDFRQIHRKCKCVHVAMRPFKKNLSICANTQNNSKYLDLGILYGTLFLSIAVSWF